MVVLFGWQYFFVPKPKPPAETPVAAQQQTEQGPPQPGDTIPGSAAPLPGATPAATLTREEALAASPRIAIDTAALKGSIALKGGRIDDLTPRIIARPSSPTARTSCCCRRRGDRILITPSMAMSGGPAIKTSPADRRHGVDGIEPTPLTQSSPITLTYDNGKGLKFTRTISVDEKYMFIVDDKVANNGGDPVTVYPYALVSRHGGRW